MADLSHTSGMIGQVDVAAGRDSRDSNLDTPVWRWKDWMFTGADDSGRLGRREI